MRRMAGTRRVGHAGTLDPMATGVLVLGVERATRLLGHLVLADKAYDAMIRLGRATTTDDAEGEQTLAGDPAGIDEAAVRAQLARLTGDIMQRPSSVSAIKVDGRRAHARVRAGEQVRLAPRPVHVARLDLLAMRTAEVDGLPVLELAVAVECSSGTYVRALARDLGAALGVGGHLGALRRTRVGPFRIEAARTLEQLAALPDPVTLPLPEAVRAGMPVRMVSADEAAELSHGRRLAPSGIDGVHGAIDPAGRAVALLEDSGGAARPVLVFEPA
jgi:tRNA pseudouridine55 synthase